MPITKKITDSLIVKLDKITPATKNEYEYFH